MMAPSAAASVDPGAGTGETGVPTADVPPQSRLGTLIHGEYRLDALIGPDDLGMLYRASSQRQRRDFTVLLLSREIRYSLKAMLAVRDDLRRGEQLQQLGLLPMKQLATADGTPAFASEILTAGETLKQRLLRGPLPAEGALALVVTLGRLLLLAHRAGFWLDSDLRPDHVFLVRLSAKGPYAGKAMLLRHGLHHLRRRHVPGKETQGPGPPGDVFTLGAMLHECLGGCPPSPGPDSVPPLLTANEALGLTPRLAETLDVIVAAACAPDPQVRIPGMAELLRTLEQVARRANIPLPEDIGKQTGLVRRLTGSFYRKPSITAGWLALMQETGQETALEPAQPPAAPPLPPPPAAPPAPPEIAPRASIPDEWAALLTAAKAPESKAETAPSPPPGEAPEAEKKPLSPATAALPNVGERDTVRLHSLPPPARRVPADTVKVAAAVQRGEMEPTTARFLILSGEDLREIGGLRGLLRPRVLLPLFGMAVLLLTLLLLWH